MVPQSCKAVTNSRILILFHEFSILFGLSASIQLWGLARWIPRLFWQITNFGHHHFMCNILIHCIEAHVQFTWRNLYVKKDFNRCNSRVRLLPTDSHHPSHLPRNNILDLKAYHIETYIQILESDNMGIGYFTYCMLCPSLLCLGCRSELNNYFTLYIYFYCLFGIWLDHFIFGVTSLIPRGTISQKLWRNGLIT